VYYLIPYYFLSAEHPTDTTGKSFRNLKYPMNWDEIFDYIKFCLHEVRMENVYRLENKEEFWEKNQRLVN
jgi:hypothetical protein